MSVDDRPLPYDYIALVRRLRSRCPDIDVGPFVRLMCALQAMGPTMRAQFDALHERFAQRVADTAYRRYYTVDRPRPAGRRRKGSHGKAKRSRDD